VITLFPADSETYVVPETRDEVLLKISRELERTPRGLVGQNLAGWIVGDDFQLTIQLRRQHMFMPVVTGTVESSSKGSIIFMNFRLFPATRLLLTFWAIVLPLAGLIVSYHYRNFFILGGAIILLIFIYLIAWLNFRLHMKTTRALLHRVLHIDG
jgi:hypothetical protein